MFTHTDTFHSYTVTHIQSLIKRENVVMAESRILYKT